MNRTELQHQIESTTRNLEWLRGIKTGCKSCEHFVDGTVCAEFGAIPAELTETNDCPKWDLVEVPF